MVARHHGIRNNRAAGHRKSTIPIRWLPCNLSSLLLHSTFFADGSFQSALAVVCIMDSTPTTCADAVRQERLQREENVSGSRDQKKLHRTGNSGWLVCAAILDCSHMLLIVAIGITHAMLARQCKACPTMLCYYYYLD